MDDPHPRRPRRLTRSGRHPAADRPFFLLAALYAALAVPVWVLVRLGAVAPQMGVFGTPAQHGHEMVTGFVLAVVAGFLFTRVSRAALVLALALWFVGRVAAFLPLPPAAAAAAGLAFPLLLFVLAGVPFLRAARSAQNAVFAPVIAAFAVAEGAFHLAPTNGALAGLGVAALLVFAMGGRVIPAATAGAMRAAGGVLAARVQPVPQWVGVTALALAVLLDLMGLYPAFAGLAAAAGGVAALARLARWRSLDVRSDPALWGLHLGYLWLGAGLVLKGAAQAGIEGLPLAGSLHALAVGGLGTVTFAMMARTVLQRRQRPVRFPPWLAGCLLLISLAAVLRLAALAPALYAPALFLAATAWAVAFLGLALFILRVRTTP